MAIQTGDRFLPLQTEVNQRFKLSSGSLTTVCLIDNQKISVYIDKVPGFNCLEVVMPLPIFAANFREINLPQNKAYAVSKHFVKEYPLYFIQKYKL